LRLCFTSAAHPLAWLALIIIILFCTENCARDVKNSRKVRVFLFRHGICSGWSHIPVVTLDCIPLCHPHIFNVSVHISQPRLLTLVTTTPESCFTPFCFNAPCPCKHFLICTLSFFGLSPVWQFYLDLSPLFLIGISVLIYTHFFRNVTRA